MDLGAISPTLAKDDDGIWRPRVAEKKTISFPDYGHAGCLALEDGSFWFAHRNALLTLALQRFPISGPFLDIGGGNGVVSGHLAHEGIETVLIEPGPEGAHNARRRGLTSVICATLEEARFAPGSFGGAGLFDVIEHVEDDAAILAATRRVLKPGGVLAVTVPSYSWLWSEEDELAGHFRRYGASQLRRVLESAGFDVRYETYFFAALTVPIFLLRSLRHRLRPRPRSVEEVQRTAEGYHAPSTLQRRAMDLLLAPELRAVTAGRSLPVGSSLLAIAIAR